MNHPRDPKWITRLVGMYPFWLANPMIESVTYPVTKRLLQLQPVTICYYGN